MSTLKKIAFVSLLTLLGGCANLVVGRRIPQDEIKRISEGRTTATDIGEWFGSPLRQTSTESGKIYVYRYIDPNASICQELIISFSEDESVCVWSKSGL